MRTTLIGWLKRNGKVLGVLATLLTGGAGAVYAEGSRADDVGDVAAEVDAVKVEVQDHVALPGHRESIILVSEIRERLDRIETKVDRLVLLGAGR